MKPLLLFSAGVGALGLALLLSRRANAAPILPTAPPSTPPPPSYGEQTRVSLAVPPGWQRVTSAEVAALPELGAAANELRSTPGFTSTTYGTLTPFVASNGKTYATWVEQHYHPPGGPTKPWGLHHGVTLLEAT